MRPLVVFVGSFLFPSYGRRKLAAYNDILGMGRLPRGNQASGMVRAIYSRTAKNDADENRPRMRTAERSSPTWGDAPQSRSPFSN